VIEELVVYNAAAENRATQILGEAASSRGKGDAITAEDRECLEAIEALNWRAAGRRGNNRRTQRITG
jgi:hypothetical protein